MDFKLPKRKDLMDIIFTGNIDKTFDLVTKEGIQKVKMLLLTDAEDTECHNYADRLCYNPNSLMTREKIYRTEVLSRAIQRWNDYEISEEDKMVEFNRKFMGMMQGPIVTRLWEFYNELRSIQTIQLSNLEEQHIKKSSGNSENLG